MILDDAGRPVAWGPSVDGADIPDPPDNHPPDEYRWNGTKWIHNPPADPAISKMSDADLVTALRDGSVDPSDVLATMIETGRL